MTAMKKIRRVMKSENLWRSNGGDEENIEKKNKILTSWKMKKNYSNQ